MQIIKEIDDFYELKRNSWSGALDTLQIIEDFDDKENKKIRYETNDIYYKHISRKRDELISLLEDVFSEPTDEYKVNDYLWFDRDSILEELEIPTED